MQPMRAFDWRADLRYETLLVHMIVGRSNGAVLKVATELAKLLGARTIGIAACHPVPMMSGPGYVDGAVIGMLQEQLDKEIGAAEVEYREALLSSKAPLEWRSSNTLSPSPDFLAREARCADLIISSALPTDRFDSMQHVNIGDLIMHAGRPVLVVPHAGVHLPFEQVVVAWKDTRESRRAVCDALPLLRAAKHVTVVEIAAADDVASAMTRVTDVATWLESHSIKATPLALPAAGSDASCLDSFLDKHNADLVVAGAYGHSRFREWAFGGVTDSLLRTGRCALLSH